MNKMAVPVWLAIFLFQVPGLALYFRRLALDPTFAWWPIILGIAFVAMLGWRWNFSVQLPSTGTATGLTLVGLLAVCTAAFGKFEWLAIIGFMLTLGGFLASNSARTSTSLLSICPLTLPLVRRPFGWLDSWELQVEELIAQGSSNVLNFLQVAHIQTDSMIAVAGARFYPHDLFHSWLGIPFWFAMVMIHSAVFRRGWPVVLLNGVASVAACAVFHIGVNVSAAYSQHNAAGWSSTFVMSIWALVTWLLFLSMERGIRGMLTPIADGAEDARQANPLVVGWNRLTRRELNGVQWQLPAAHSRTLLMVLLILTVLAGVAQAMRLPEVLGAKTAPEIAWRPTRNLVSSVWPNSESVDYRQERGRQHGASDHWMYFSPLRDTKFKICLEPQRWQDQQQQYVLDDWNIVSERMVDSEVRVVELERRGTVGILIYAAISADGEAISPERAIDQPCLMLSSFSSILRTPSDETKNSLTAEFTELFKQTTQAMQATP
ncbi:MAG: hypothetical protein R3C53_26305 [Pirellulaceae bacterium]